MRECVGLITAAEKRAKRAVGHANAVEVSVKQRIGNAALLLDSFSERGKALVDIADIDDEIGLERSQRVEIDVVAAAAGQSRHLRPRRNIGEQEFASVSPDRLQPTDKQIRCERI